MTGVFISTGALFALIGVFARSLSSHAIQPFLLERGTLNNFNLAADYLIFHGLAVVAVAILYYLFPAARYERAGFLFILGSLLFQGSVFAKSYVDIGSLGIVTPIGGFILMLGWGVMVVIPLFYAGQH